MQEWRHRAGLRPYSDAILATSYCTLRPRRTAPLSLGVATYALSFDLGGSTFWGRPDAITASAAGTSNTFTTPLTGTNNDWQHVSMQFTASSSLTTVRLQGATGSNYIGLDNASVDFVSGPAVPEPSTVALLSLGLAGVVLARKRKARTRAI